MSRILFLNAKTKLQVLKLYVQLIVNRNGAKYLIAKHAVRKNLNMHRDCAKLDKKNSHELQRNIFVINYHKTGYILTKNLINAFLNDKNIKGKVAWSNTPIVPRAYYRIGHKLMFPVLSFWGLSAKYNIYSFNSPNFLGDIKKQMPKVNKIVHLIRPPYEHCLSNFLYHTQTPTPEGWFIEMGTDHTQWFDRQYLLCLFEKLGLESSELNSIMAIFNDLYQCPNGMTYVDYLRSLPRDKALLIESIRFILAAGYGATKRHERAGCDILIEAIIAKNLLVHNDIAITFTLNDFSSKNLKRTIEVMSDFLYDEKLDVDNLFQICNNHFLSSQKGQHVTSNKISLEEKNHLLSSLRNSPISSILDKLEPILEQAISHNRSYAQSA